MQHPTFSLWPGGGPGLCMQGPDRRRLHPREQGLRELTVQRPARPSAIVVVSSHGAVPTFSFTASAAPGMVDDLHGFPPETDPVSSFCLGIDP